jgi:molybdate transport system substrate-binding protein
MTKAGRLLRPAFVMRAGAGRYIDRLPAALPAMSLLSTLPRCLARLLWGGAGLCVSSLASAATLSVAVAANFTAPMQQLAPLFEAASGHQLQLSYGSSGKFFAQITQGAPFQVLLSADEGVPRRLVQAGVAVAGSQFTYATGQLVLWRAQGPAVADGVAVLRSGTLQRLAMANPELAPYGRAALETLTSLGLQRSLAPRLVMGESITQAYQFVASGNADWGLVALSQVWRDDQFSSGAGWRVPDSLHQPIHQDAVLLKPGRGQPAATAFLTWLKSEPARAVIRRFGYSL